MRFRFFLPSLLVLVAACQSTPKISNEILLGTWHEETTTTEQFIRFSPDGSYAIAENVNDFEKYPSGDGTYKLEGTTLTLTSSGDKFEFCDPGEIGTFQLEQTNEGTLVITKIDDECSMRALYISVEWEKVKD